MEGILKQRTNRRSIYAAGAVAIAITAATAAMLPVAAQPLPIVQPFFSMFAMAVFIVENLTFYLLAIQSRTSRQPFLAALSGAYGFVAVMVFFQVLIFPGVFSPTGLLGAGKQSAIWLWTMWHGGFPFFIALALIMRVPQIAKGRDTLLRRLGNVQMVGAPLVAMTLVYLAIAGGGMLPPLIDGISYTTLEHSTVARLAILTNIVALLLCIYVSRLRDLLSLWLAIALLTGLCDCALTLTASARYSLGWYSGRILSVMSSSMVLGVLIWEISRLYHKVASANMVLTERAIRDGLTGAFNRRYFIDQFPQQVQQAVRAKAPLSLLLMDADHFKKYNDTLGHQMGDRCLMALVGATQKVVQRPTDYVARYGGEEFVIVLPHTDTLGAVQIAQHIRAAIADLRLARTDTAARFVTVSIGIATLDPAGEPVSTEELISRADQALYQAKHAGRDTFRVYGTEYGLEEHTAALAAVTIAGLKAALPH